MVTKEVLRKSHWESIYDTKAPNEVSWYQGYPELSLKLIKESGLEKDQSIIDVGGGTSLLVDYLLDMGYTDVAVLDISERSLEITKKRLGVRKDNVTWYKVDITEFNPPRKYSLWHDRAVFHFLIDEDDKREYVEVLKKSLNPGGFVVVATFAVDGPSRCSGLDVVRYDMDSICSKFGPDFKLVNWYNESHYTPSNKEQRFTYFMFKR